MSQYVVVDLEMCRVPQEKRKTGFRWANETIQIGAVLLNEQYEVIDEFNEFVSPEYGCLDWYITRLTGITSRDLKDAPKMQDALIRFIDWIPEDGLAVSWSDNDLKQIRHEAEAKNIEDSRLNRIIGTWIDCQKMFSDRLQDKRIYKLSEALIAADIIQEGQEHNGLIDAINTAKLFSKMMKEPEMKLNSIFTNARSEEVVPLSFSIGDLFSNLQLA